jgi:hypothetical protein
MRKAPDEGASEKRTEGRRSWNQGYGAGSSGRRSWNNGYGARSSGRRESASQRLSAVIRPERRAAPSASKSRSFWSA